jgi:hypothetical protein
VTDDQALVARPSPRHTLDPAAEPVSVLKRALNQKPSHQRSTCTHWLLINALAPARRTPFWRPG